MDRSQGPPGAACWQGVDMLRSIPEAQETMATLTIRDLPDGLIQRLEFAARRKGLSLEEEVRNLLVARYVDKVEVLDRARARWESLPPVSGAEIAGWRSAGRE
jgi:antitoxin FitA